MNKVPLNITTSVFKCSIREPLGTFYIQNKISHMSLPNEITVFCLFVCLFACLYVCMVVCFILLFVFALCRLFRNGILRRKEGVCARVS